MEVAISATRYWALLYMAAWAQAMDLSLLTMVVLSHSLATVPTVSELVRSLEPRQRQEATAWDWQAREAAPSERAWRWLEIV